MDLLQRLSRLPADAAAAAGWLQVHVPAGTTLFEQGDDADTLYVVAEGLLAVRVDGVEIAQVGAGASLGEASVMMFRERRLGAAVALQDTVLWSAKREIVQVMAARLPRLYDHLLHRAMTEMWERLLEVDHRLMPHLDAEDPSLGAPTPIDASTLSGAPPDKDRILATLPVLCRQPRGVRDAISKVVRWADLDGGQILFAQGDLGDGLFVVGSGRISIRRHKTGRAPRELSVLHAGAVFGAAGFIQKVPRTATAIAVSASRILRIGRDDVMALNADARRAVELLVISTMRAQQRAAVQLLAQLENAPDEPSLPNPGERHLVSDAASALAGWDMDDEFPFDEPTSPTQVPGLES